MGSSTPISASFRAPTQTGLMEDTRGNTPRSVHHCPRQLCSSGRNRRPTRPSGCEQVSEEPPPGLERKAQPPHDMSRPKASWREGSEPGGKHHASPFPKTVYGRKGDAPWRQACGHAADRGPSGWAARRRWGHGRTCWRGGNTPCPCYRAALATWGVRLSALPARTHRWAHWTWKSHPVKSTENPHWTVPVRCAHFTKRKLYSFPPE